MCARVTPGCDRRPSTYRRGFAADVQALLPLDRDGGVVLPDTAAAR